jgi:hypothetical protein
MLILHTGDQPIKRICKPSHKKHNECLIESAVDQQPNVAGNQENTEDGQAVGDIHICKDIAATTAGGDDRRALHGCQRLAVGAAPPYNQSLGSIISCECDGEHDEFVAAAFQKRRID